MAILGNTLQAEIESLPVQAHRLYNAGDLQSCLEFHERAWSMYPEPRNNWNEAYNTAKYAVDDCFSALDIKNAKTWLERMAYVNDQLHQRDEELMHYTGKYKYEMGDYDAAFTAFDKVVKIAGKRYFEDEPSKYLNFYIEKT